MQMWLPNPNASPTVLGKEHAPLARQSFDLNASCSNQFPWTTPKENYPHLCAESVVHTQAGARNQLQNCFRRGFIAIYKPACSSSCWLGPRWESQRAYALGWQEEEVLAISLAFTNEACLENNKPFRKKPKAKCLLLLRDFSTVVTVERNLMRGTACRISLRGLW